MLILYELWALSKLLLVMFSCFEEIAFPAFFLQQAFTMVIVNVDLLVYNITVIIN